MKKVMFIIVGMLLSFGASAATLTLTGDGSNAGDVVIGSGQVVTADWESSVGGGEGVHDKYSITTDELSGGYLTLTFNTLADNTTVGIDDGNGVVGLSIAEFGRLGQASYFWVLAANTVYDIYIDILAANPGSNYDLRVETPIPAALFLFAPALLGFFGLRRKAAVAA